MNNEVQRPGRLLRQILKNKAKRPQQGRLLAIGDIHGCLEQLVSLFGQVAPTPDDQVVFLGDYVDRGPDSAGVLDFLLTFREQHPRTVFLRGNHEQMFLEFLEGGDSTAFLINGGTKTLHSYQSNGHWPIPISHHRFIKDLAYYHETDNFIFVHAGLRPGIPLAAQDPEDMLWIRKEFIDSDYDWGKTIVFGHTPLTEPLQSDKRIGLDTGCVYGRVLTCCDVNSRRFWQA
jgi:serine/threonine protein phosphatase 1